MVGIYCSYQLPIAIAAISKIVFTVLRTVGFCYATPGPKRSSKGVTPRLLNCQSDSCKWWWLLKLLKSTTRWNTWFCLYNQLSQRYGQWNFAMQFLGQNEATRGWHHGSWTINQILANGGDYWSYSKALLYESLGFVRSAIFCHCVEFSIVGVAEPWELGADCNCKVGQNG